jgi:hypothetical protein
MLTLEFVQQASIVSFDGARTRLSHTACWMIWQSVFQWIYTVRVYNWHCGIDIVWSCLIKRAIKYSANTAFAFRRGLITCTIHPVDPPSAQGTSWSAKHLLLATWHEGGLPPWNMNCMKQIRFCLETFWNILKPMHCLPIRRSKQERARFTIQIDTSRYSPIMSQHTVAKPCYKGCDSRYYFVSETNADGSEMIWTCLNYSELLFVIFRNIS